MKFLRLLPKIILLLVLTLPVALAIMAIDKQAITLQKPELNSSQITNLQQLLIDHDPRQLINSNDQEIQLTESEVNALLNYLTSSFLKNNILNTTYLDTQNIALNADLMPDNVRLAATLPISSTPFGKYINLTIILVPDKDFVRIQAVQVGSLSIPAIFHQALFKLLEDRLQDNSNYLLFDSIRTSIEKIAIEENQLNITLNWQDDNLDKIRNQARNLFISPEEKLKLKDYHNQLVKISQSFSPEIKTVSLTNFLQPMFSTALANSTAGSDPLIENRAIFIALAAYLNKLDLELLIGSVDINELAKPRQLQVKFESRSDIPQHITGSAAIAASAGAEIADILSIYKEVHDSRYRSTGFSFSDITANQVGTRLGSLATRNTEDAIQFQEVMSKSQTDSDFMPSVRRFDGLTEQEFIQRYKNRQSEAYLLRLEEIEKTISQRVIFKAF